MKKSDPKNKKNLSILLLGIFIGVLVIAVAGAVAYQLSGRDLKGKVRFVINRIGENVNYYRQRIISDNLKEAMDTENEKDGILLLTIDANKTIGAINPMIYGSNLTAKTEFEMDIANFGKDVGITNVRFPGGGSLGYRWKLSNFDFDERYDHAPLANIENVIKFCGIMGSQLIIQVNIESGTSEEAAQWVYYMNKGKKGMRVDYWELGNEVYGDWDKGYMSGEDYVKVVKEYAPAFVTFIN